MSVPDAWLSSTGANIQNRQRSAYERTYWDRLSEPSIILALVVLLLSVLLSTNAISVPSALGTRLWNLLVTVTPASLIFAIDDWSRPFPLPRRPLDRLSSAAAHQEKSNAFRRILGRDPGGGGGVFSTVSHAGKTGLSRLMARGGTDRPAGLGNMSYSCYQNSVLQSLASLEPLRDYLAWIANEEAAGGLPPLRTAHTLGKLVGDLYGSGLNGETLWTPADLKRMSTFQQQDAQEYFCKLLNEVQEEVEKALKEVKTYPGFETKLDSVPSALGSDNLKQVLPALESAGFGAPRPSSEDSGYGSNSTSSARRATSVATSFRIPLEGLVAQRIVCQSCNYSSGLSMNPFYCLTLNLSPGAYEQRLEDALDNFSEVENIEGVQCASCTLRKFRERIQALISHFESKSNEGAEEARQKQPMLYERLEAIEAAIREEDFEEKTLADKCKIPDKQRVEAIKSRQVGIARAPPSIAFHINRSSFDETTGYTYKNPAAVRFPLRLDLGPWCLGSASLHAAEPSTSTRDEVDEHGECNEEKNAAAPPPSHDRDDQEEQWQLPAQQPMVSGTKNPSRITGPMYELRAVITHQGQHENGHYICYRKHPVAPQQPPADDEKKCLLAKEEVVDPALEEDTDAAQQTDKSTDDVPGTASEGDEAPERTVEEVEEEQEAYEYEKYGEWMEAGPQWWRLSDQDVSRSDEQTVLSQGGVFMLFYDRVDPASVFRSPDPSKMSTVGSDSREASIASGSNNGLSSNNTSLDGMDYSAADPIYQAKIENDSLGADEKATSATPGSFGNTAVDVPAREAIEPEAAASVDRNFLGRLGPVEGMGGKTPVPIS